MKKVLLPLIALLFSSLILRAQESYRIYAPDTIESMRFGNTIAASGNYIIVGAFKGEAAYIYKNSGITWTLDAKLAASDGEPLDLFGQWVSMSGDYAIVGASGDDDQGDWAGAAYIFKRTSSGWLQQAKLLAPDGRKGYRFGSSVAISEDYAVIGMPNYPTPPAAPPGSVYVFKRKGESWEFKFKLTGGPDYVSFLGRSVAISGNYVIASGGGYSWSSPNRHLVYFIDSTHWERQANLGGLEGPAAIWGDNIIIGSASFWGVGSAHIYQRNGITWENIAILEPSDGKDGDKFGSSVAIFENFAVVGARYHGDPSTGAAYVFKSINGNWVEVGKLTGLYGHLYPRFGSGAAVSENGYFVCANEFNEPSFNSGVVCVFEAEPIVKSELTLKKGSDDCLSNAGAYLLNDFCFKFTNSTGAFSRFSNSDAPLKVFLPDEDTIQVEIVPPNFYWSVCDYNPEIITAGIADSIDREYLAYPSVECTFMSVDITAPLLRRCFPSDILVYYCNKGTIPADQGKIRVVLDPFMTFLSSTLPPESQQGDTLMFDLGTVGIAECGKFTIKVEINCEAEPGTLHCYSAHIYPDTLCISGTGINLRAEDSDVGECRENVGSFDPNDKMGFPFETGDMQYVKKNKDLKYQIRFQNTGTDTAFTVVILDTIAENLDLSTFRLGAVSYPVEVTIKDDRVVKFSFKNLLLPDDKVNEPASHGFINYFISQKKDLPEGTLISNRAAIYFDFNDPVITNNVVHTVGIRPLKPKERIAFEIFPNPSSGTGEIRLALKEPKPGKCLIYDLRGRLVAESRFDTVDFDLPAMPSGGGVYLVKVVLDSGHWGFRKWIVIL